MMLDNNEIQRLAAMGSALRPDWPARSLRTWLEKNLADRAFGDIAVALAWVATRTKTDTPRLLLEAGPWWKACQVDGTTAPRNYRVPCTEHPGETLPCGRCANEAVPASKSRALNDLRANLAAAKAAREDTTASRDDVAGTTAETEPEEDA